MKKFAMLVLLVAFGASLASAAETNNPLWMFTSRSSMDLYKATQIKRASATLWSGASVDEINCQADAWAYNTNNDTLNVFELLRGQHLTLSVARPSLDQVGFSGWLYDAKDHPLFYAQNYSSLVSTNGAWAFPAGLMKAETYSYPDCYVTVSNAFQAKVILRDEAGNVVQTKGLNVNNGEIQFDYNDLGRNADLAITTYDPSGTFSTSLTSLRGDAEAKIQQIAANSPDLSIHGMTNYNNVDHIDYLTVTPVSSKGQGESPILRMQVTAAKSLYLFTKTTDGEEPLKVTVMDTAGVRADCPIVNDPCSMIKHAEVKFPHAGIWYITYDWQSFDNQVYTYPWWYGEKG